MCHRDTPGVRSAAVTPPQAVLYSDPSQQRCATVTPPSSVHYRDLARQQRTTSATVTPLACAALQ